MIDKFQFSTVARLRELLATMERDLGLTSLSSNELDLLYAVRLVSDQNKEPIVEASDIREHPITRQMSQPTFNRTIRSLLEKGYLETAPNHKAKRYQLSSRAAM